MQKFLLCLGKHDCYIGSVDIKVNCLPRRSGDCGLFSPLFDLAQIVKQMVAAVSRHQPTGFLGPALGFFVLHVEIIGSPNRAGSAARGSRLNNVCLLIFSPN